MNSLYSELYGDNIDMTRTLYGQDARHVPAWIYVQKHGNEVVGLVGASRVPPGTAHPLLYGSSRQHTFIVGEIIIRPHIVIATDALRGAGAGNLYLGDHDFTAMLADGELIVGSEGSMHLIRGQWEKR